MRILGLDPGMLRLGFAGVSIENDNVSLISCGMISNPRAASDTFNMHLNAGIEQIVNEFPRILDLVQPDKICAETVPVGRLGMNTELVIAAITTCKVVALQFGIPWNDLGANTVKKIVTDDGHANKTKVRNTILQEFPQLELKHKQLKKEQKLDGIVRPEGLPQDVFDAIAIAVAGAKNAITEMQRLSTGETPNAVL